MSTADLWRAGAAEMMDGLRSGAFTSRELVTSCLQRIEEVNPAINAMTEVRPEAALAVAEEADRIREAGQPVGLLHGIPVSIKSNVDVKGWATVNGCEALRDNIAPANSDCVQNWLDAGAIILGRTNTPEFSCRWETSNEVYGLTRNPHDLSRSPGGSSGGAAASLATGITALAHGTDLGGSLRDPAQACGLASIRPGLGRVACWNPTDPEDQGMGMQLMNTDGVMARRVADVRLGLRAMSARRYHDPGWAGVPLAQGNGRRTVALVGDPAAGGISRQVADGIEKAGRLLDRAGYRVEPVEPPGIEEAAGVWLTICLGELLTRLAPAVEDFCGDRLRTTFAHYRSLRPELTLEKYMSALARRNSLRRRWLNFFQQYGLVAAPVCTEPPLPSDSDQESAERVREIVHSQRMTVAINALGLPAAVVPVGFEGGLPQVVQLIGPPFSEMDCLAAAQAIEEQAGALPPVDPR